MPPANSPSPAPTPRDNALTALAIDRVAELAREGNRYEIVHIETAGLGERLPKRVPVLWRPGHDLQAIKSVIEAYRLHPERRLGTATVLTLQSFVDLVNRHKDEGSVIFAQSKWPEPKLVAVIDYHAVDHTPRHGEHRVVYPFPVTEELKAWIGGNGKAMEQADFARFLEDHAAELAAPDDGERSEFEFLFKEKFATPAELISLSRSLEIFVGAKVKRAERLASGERTVEFVEEHTNSKGEKVEIPGIFMVSVPAFLDGEKVRIPARLRYRAGGGGIMWFYQLYRWEWWLRVRVQEDLRVAGKETGLPTFEGEPENRR